MRFRGESKIRKTIPIIALRPVQFNTCSQRSEVVSLQERIIHPLIHLHDSKKCVFYKMKSKYLSDTGGPRNMLFWKSKLWMLVTHDWSPRCSSSFYFFCTFKNGFLCIHINYFFKNTCIYSSLVFYTSIKLN